MKNLILCMLMLCASTAVAQDTTYGPATLEELVRAEYQLAAEAMLASENSCDYDYGNCARVDLDYPYPYRDRYDDFLDVMADATAQMHFEGIEQREVFISTLLAVAWAESTWDTLTREGADGECGPLQVITCEGGQARGWNVECQNGEYLEGYRPTCRWLEDPVNSLTWFVSFWEQNNGPHEYNGCGTPTCDYALLFNRRYSAMLQALSQR